MNLIEIEKSKSDYIIQLYEEIRSEFKGQTDTIVGILDSSIAKFAENYGLKIKSPLKEIKYYSVVSRVKDVKSLEEKIFRNDLLSKNFKEISNEFIVDGPTEVSIKNYLRSLDDLIGIRVLTDLNSDCKKVYQIINSNDFKEFIKGSLIEFDKEDLDDQPSKMKNGLEIYKIKGKYNQIYNFELQIKSKIIAAWGDMEHSIFYKDYSISPIKESTQASMNHIGKLLFQIDDFLESVRVANKSYKENSEVISFLLWIDNHYSSLINTGFKNINYRMDGFSEAIFAFYKNLKLDSENKLDEFRICVEHFLFDNLGANNKKYFELRNSSNNLKILESICLIWLNREEDITEANIDSKLTLYQNRLIHSVSDSLITNRKNGYDLDEMIEIYTHYFNLGLEYKCNDSFILNINEFYELFMVLKNMQDSFDGDIGPEKIKVLTDMLFISYYSGKISTYKQTEQCTAMFNNEEVTEKMFWLVEQYEKKIDALDKKIKKSVNKLVK